MVLTLDLKHIFSGKTQNGICVPKSSSSDDITSNGGNNFFKSTDTFEYTNKNSTSQLTYSNKSYLNRKTTNNEISTNQVMKVQTAVTKSATNSFCNVVVSRAAKNAGISVDANGSPIINSAAASKKYLSALNKIESTYWCQTGGWSNLSGDGRTECARTATATMASINSNSIVTPNDTQSQVLGVTVNNKTYSRNTGGSYNITSGAGNGLYSYDLSSSKDLINAVNNELMNNRSVVVKTTVAGEHWVTVTGTKNGKPAKSFDDFIGIDPWYNGSNPENASSSTGNGSTRADRSGVISLSTVTNQNLHSEYKMFTFKIW